MGTHTEVGAHTGRARWAVCSKRDTDRSAGKALSPPPLLENTAATNEVENTSETSNISLLNSFQGKNSKSSPKKKFEDANNSFKYHFMGRNYR